MAMEASSAEESEPDSGGIDDTLTRLSDRVEEMVETVRPSNPKLWRRLVKIVLTVVLTVMYVYWVIAWQFDIQWFEF